MKQQHELPHKQREALKWSSHLPINNSVIKTFPITGVLELGAGVHSTSMFFKNAPRVISVEADSRWISKLRNDHLIVEDDDHQIIHHNIPTISRTAATDAVSVQAKNEAVAFYKSLMNEHLNFLFVDCYVSLRLVALMELYQMFDVITYHDAEPAADPHYKYSELRIDPSYMHFVDRTFLVHNGLIISNRMVEHMQQFNNTFVEECNHFAASFNTTHTVVLERIS